MRARKISATALLGMLSVAACGGGGGVNSDSVSDPNQTGGPDVPTSGYDVPPGGGDNPPGDDIPPPSTDSPGSASGDVPGSTCPKLCNAFFSHQCSCPGDDLGVCVAGCNAALPGFGPCIGQTNALIDCALASPSFIGCNIFQGDANAGDYRECTIQALNFVHCFELNDFDVDDFADDSSSGLGDCGGSGGTGGDGPQGGDGGKGGPPPRGGANGMGTGGTGVMAGSGGATGGLAGGGVGGQ